MDRSSTLYKACQMSNNSPYKSKWCHLLTWMANWIIHMLSSSFRTIMATCWALYRMLQQWKREVPRTTKSPCRRNCRPKDTRRFTSKLMLSHITRATCTSLIRASSPKALSLLLLKNKKRKERRREVKKISLLILTSNNNWPNSKP